LRAQPPRAIELHAARKGPRPTAGCKRGKARESQARRKLRCSVCEGDSP